MVEFALFRRGTLTPQIKKTGRPEGRPVGMDHGVIISMVV